MSKDAQNTLNQEQVDAMLACEHQHTVFHGRIIKGLDFSERDLSNVFFAGLLIQDTSFRNSYCAKTSFYSSILENVDFSGADLRKTTFREATINSCSFKNVQAPLWKRIYLWLKNS